jgi:hypothetical protein
MSEFTYESDVQLKIKLLQNITNSFKSNYYMYGTYNDTDIDLIEELCTDLLHKLQHARHEKNASMIKKIYYMDEINNIIQKIKISNVLIEKYKQNIQLFKNFIVENIKTHEKNIELYTNMINTSKESIKKNEEILEKNIMKENVDERETITENHVYSRGVIENVEEENL